MTLKKLLKKHGMAYCSVLGNRAKDIDFDSREELFEALGYILGHYQRFDFEIPDDRPKMSGAYEINNGITSGGNEMKYSNQYRIYFRTIANMPAKLRKRLQNDNKMRITGSSFVEACYHLGFVPGANQDEEKIVRKICRMMQTSAEKEAFEDGYYA